MLDPKTSQSGYKSHKGLLRLRCGWIVISCCGVVARGVARAIRLCRSTGRRGYLPAELQPGHDHALARRASLAKPARSGEEPDQRQGRLESQTTCTQPVIPAREQHFGVRYPRANCAGHGLLHHTCTTPSFHRTDSPPCIRPPSCRAWMLSRMCAHYTAQDARGRGGQRQEEGRD